MRISRPFNPCLSLVRPATWAALFLVLCAFTHAVPLDTNATKQIWKLKYGATDTQVGDNSWLDQDTDGDGIKNKDEIAAGTNPFNAGSTVRITNITAGTTTVDLTFPTENGKQYVVQGTDALANAFTSTGVTWNGVGGSKTLTVTKGSNKFFRVQVQDIDTDSDGVSNWAELAVSLNPATATTEPGVNDLAYVNQQIALPNTVTIKAVDAFASEDGPTPGKMTITRSQNLFPITVNYGVSGTALPGLDYTTLGTSVAFAARGATSADIFVNPMNQAPTIKGGRSVTATLNGPGAVDFPFTINAPNNTATVIINSSTVPTGTGLLGRYYDHSNGTYAHAANFGDAANYAFTRNTSPTTQGSIVVTPTTGNVSAILSALSVGSQVKLTFLGGNLNNALYNHANYSVTSKTSTTFTVSISAATALPTSSSSTCNFSIQSSPHPAVIERLDTTVNFDWQYGTPNGVVISPNNSPENYSATWEGYLQPSVTGDYTFQLDADDKARVLLDTGSGLVQILEHGWDGPATVGTFKQSALINLTATTDPAQRYHIRVEHVETTGDARCRLQWKVPGTTAFANIPQANQFTHTQAMTSYSYTAGSAVITPAGGHAFNVNDQVTLAFSSGVLFTPGAASTHNKTYTITAVSGTTTYTVGITGFPVSISGAITTAGSNLISVPSITGLAVGMTVTGTGLPAGEVITSIVAPTATAPGLIAVTTGTGVTAQANTTLTAVLPATGTTTGNGFVLNNTTSTTTGLYNLCYPNTAFSGSPGRVGVDGAVTTGNNGLWGAGSPDVSLMVPDTFSIRWTGQVQPQFSEDYTFAVLADDGCALWINGQPQVLKISPSNLNGGSNYKYDSSTGSLVVTYTSQPPVAGSFIVGEAARIDPSSGALAHVPTNTPTYTYDSATGNAVIDYTNLIVGSAGGTRVAGSYAVGEVVELDPTSGNASSLGQFPYTITAVSGNTFTVNFGMGQFVTGNGNVTISDNRNAIITAVHPAGTYNYTSTTGVTTVSYASFAPVMTGSFAVGNTIDLEWLSGNLSSLPTTNYTITAVDPVGLTFTITATTGLVNTSGAVILRSVPGGVTIPASGTTAFTVNIGAGKYASTTNSTINVDIVNKSLKDWSSNGNERYVRIPMVGGVRYDIKLDYYENTSYARCGLSWYSASQPKQIIPAERLYPSSVPQAPPSHIAATDGTALVGGLFSHPLAGSNGAIVTLSGNPAWLSYSNGVLSGTPPPGAGGDYQILVTITNSAGTTTSVVNLHVDENGGSVVREYWTGVSGTSVANIPTSTTPNGTANLTSLQAPTDFGDNYGARIRGYITAPTTGNYYFWIAASNGAELWISNDDEPINAFKRAWVTTGSATPLTWNGEGNQKSPWLALEQGKKYYVEILHKAGTGSGDNLAVGWAKPGEATTAPSQVVPSFVLSPYVAPAPNSTPGTLYVASMLTQAGAVTNGVGSSTLRLSEDESYAIMRYSYSGLTGPITSQHIHTDPYLAKPSTIVFDIDTPGAAQTNLGGGLQPDGSYKWFILPVGTLSAADIREIIKEGKAYINLHTAAYPNGEIRGNYTLANGTRTFTPPPAPPSWADDGNTSNGAARFLAQATFGANPADIAALKALTPAGTTNSRYEKWINDQFLIAPTQHLPEVMAREIADVFGPFDVKVAFNTWWKTSMTAPDQLRQRVAYALSQIHVVSGQGPLEDNSRAISDFYDTLAANAFGNFRDILIGTTLTPAMGRYLDMLRNDKPDLSVGRSPNENYAREIKQLFSIGLYRMWPDGTLMLTSDDSPIDTYTQREIVGLAHVFTGWEYGYSGEYLTGFNAAADWTRPMREVPVRHFTGPKRLLNNEVLPGLSSLGGQPLDPYATHVSSQYTDPTYEALPGVELAAVHDILFNHANTGPFICRQLIQRLVTSHPSRDYLYRVVQKFNDNGSGVRGDMKAVIKAILLDYEARSSDLLAIPAYGKQREPILRVAEASRAFRPSDASGTYSQTAATLFSGTVNGVVYAGTPTITVTTSVPHLLAAGNSVFLEFTDATVAGAQPAPTTGTYTVLSTPTTTTYTIPAPGWLTGTYSQSAGSNVMTITMSGHYLPGDNANVIPAPQVLPAANKGQAYFDFTTGTANGLAGFDQTVRTVATSTSYDIPSGVGNSAMTPSINGNTAGTTFTIIAPDTTARSGNVMISRFGGGYQSTGRNGVITIDTTVTTGGGTNAGNYGAMADHGLSVGDSVFINFANSRDTTSFNETSTQNDLVYTITSVPDPNTFTVAAVDAANAAMNSDNQAFIFPHKAQPLVRNGTIVGRPSTFTLDNTDPDLQQTPLNSPTVFNYYLPDYKFSGTLASQGITTPEFELTSETTVIRQANFLYNGIFNPSNTTGISSFKSGTNALVLDLSPWMGNAVNTAGSIGYILGNGTLGAGQQIGQVWTSNANLPTLIDRLNTLLMGGQLPSGAKTAILNFIGRQITGITVSNPCTINMGTPHGLATGDSVTISGVTGGTFQLVSNSSATSINGTFAVTVPAGANPTTFTISTIKCTSVSGLNLTDSTAGIIPYTNAGPSATNIRDRLRAVVHFILTSPDYTIQR